MKIALKLFVVTLFISMLPALVHAQTCVDGQDPGCSPDNYCPCPIDNGVLFLVGVVVILAAKRSFDLKRKKLSIVQ